MIAFQSVTASARTAEGMAEAIGIASITATHRKKFKRFMGLILSLGLRYIGKTSFPARRPSAGAVPCRTDFKSVPLRLVRSLLGGKDPTGRLFFLPINDGLLLAFHLQFRHQFFEVVPCAERIETAILLQTQIGR